MDPLQYISRKTLLTFGTSIHEVTRGSANDNIAIVDHIYDHLDALEREPFTSPEREAERICLSILTQTSNGHLQIVALHRWAEAGFPIVTMPHTYAAALLVTNATKEAVEAARPPFPAFLLEIPDRLLPIQDPRDASKQEDITHVLVTKLDSNRLSEGWAWAYIAFTRNGLTLYRFGVTSLELLPAWIDDDELPGGRMRNQEHGLDLALSFEVTDLDKRSFALLGRLIVNASLAFSDPSNVTSRAPKDVTRNKPGGGKNRKNDEPTGGARTYVLGKPVQHDFREAVRSYLSGQKKSAPNVQVLVAGHYKMQPHGPKSALRKLIWRAPFWRGPEGAPIPIRPHELGGREK